MPLASKSVRNHSRGHCFCVSVCCAGPPRLQCRRVEAVTMAPHSNLGNFVNDRRQPRLLPRRVAQRFGRKRVLGEWGTCHVGFVVCVSFFCFFVRLLRCVCVWLCAHLCAQCVRLLCFWFSLSFVLCTFLFFSMLCSLFFLATLSSLTLHSVPIPRPAD